MANKDTSDSIFDEEIPKEIKRGVNYILAIAIDKYDTIRPLSNCVKDLEDITDILQTKYTFTNDNIRKLYNADATSDNILAELDKYSTILKKEDTLTVFFSGHGDNHNGIGFWIPVNARLNKFSEYLSLSTVCDFLEPIKARHILVVADACYSGLLFKKNTRSALKPEAAEDEPSRYAITAGRNQKVSDGDFGENSPFADAFKKELLKNEKPIGIVILSEKVLQEVNKKTKEKEKQTPRHGELELRGNKSGQFYFHIKQGIDSAEQQEIGKLLLRLAEEVFDPGIYKVAIRHFEFADKQAALANVQMPELIYWKGRAHQGLDEHKLAMECFAQFLEQNKSHFLKSKSLIKKIINRELLIDAMYQYVVSAVVADRLDLAKDQLMALQKHDGNHWKSKALTELILSDEQTGNSPSTPKKIYLLLVGIDNYKNYSALGHVNDVKLFNHTLKSIYASSAFDVHSISLTDQESTFLKLKEAFNFIQKNAQENDIVLFYFSGHAKKNFWENQNEEYTLLLFDTDPDFNKNEYLLRKTEVHDTMRAIEATRKFVILDTYADETWLEQVMLEGDYTLMFGCSEGESPKEKYLGSEIHGNFTATLIALVDENKNTGEDIYVRKFYAQLNERLVNDDQKPSIIGDIIPLFFTNYSHEIIAPKSTELMKHFLNPFDAPPEEFHRYISRKFQQRKFLCLPFILKYAKFLIKSRALNRAVNYYTFYTQFEDSLENLIKIVQLNDQMGDFVKTESLLDDWLSRHPEVQAQHPARELLEKYRIYLQNDNRYALLIGISQYQNLDRFKSGSKNAQLWFTHLTESLGFKSENIVILVDEQASRQNIIEQYLKFAELADKYPVLFFFSGYGTSYETDKYEIEHTKGFDMLTTYESHDHKCIPAILSYEARGNEIPDILFSELNQPPQGKHLVSVFDMGLKKEFGGCSPDEQVIKKRDIDLESYIDVNIAESLMYPVGKASLLPGVLNKHRVNEKKKVWYAENKEGGIFTQSILKILSDPSQRFSLSELSKTISRKRIDYSLKTSGYYLSPILLGEEDISLFTPYQLGKMEIATIINLPLVALQHKLNQLSISLLENFSDTQVISAIVDAHIGDTKLASSKLGTAAADEKQEIKRDVKANYHLGKLLVETSEPNDNGAWSQALNALRTYQEMNPDFKPTHYYLGKAINQLFQIEGRVNAAKSFQHYADSGYPIGKKEEVETFLDNLDDQRLKKRRLEEGLSHLSKYEYREAEQCLQEAFNLGENSAQYHLGVLFENQNEQLRALNAYQQAIALGVKTDDLTYRLGNMLCAIYQGTLLEETINAIGDKNNANLDSRNEKLINDLEKLKKILSQINLSEIDETGSSR